MNSYDKKNLLFFLKFGTFMENFNSVKDNRLLKIKRSKAKARLDLKKLNKKKKLNVRESKKKSKLNSSIRKLTLEQKKINAQKHNFLWTSTKSCKGKGKNKICLL